MKISPNNSRNLIILVLAIAFMARLGLAFFAAHPGHGDTAFYYTLAENIASGRGFVIDYIWHYLSKPAAITHPANDFWMPLASVIISLFMLVLGKSMLAALLPSILFGLGIAILTYFWSRVFTKSDFVWLSAAGLVLFLPLLFAFSLLTDSTTYYVFFVTAAFYCLCREKPQPKHFLLASLFIGLAHLTRADGVLLVPVLIVAVLLSPYRLGKKMIYIALSLLVYLAVLTPFLMWNIQTSGHLFSSASVKTAFITQFEDPYSYGKEFTLQSYLASGWGNIIAAKAKAALINIKTFYNSLGSFLLIFSLVGFYEFFINNELRKKWRLYFPPALFGILLYLFYTFIANLPGSGGAFGKSILSIFPFLVIVALETLGRHVASKKIQIASVIIAGLFFFGHGFLLAEKNIATNNRLGSQLTALKTILENQPQADKETIIMTRDPWEIYHSTRYKTIQIPYDGLETIYRVAMLYQANYLLLPAPRTSLGKIYSGELNDPRFILVATIPKSDLKLFRIQGVSNTKTEP